MMRRRTMSEGGKDWAAFLVPVAVSAALSLGGLLWLGVDGLLPVEMTAEGEATRTVSPLFLWFSTVLVIVLLGPGLLLKRTMGAPWLYKMAGVELPPADSDKARALERLKRQLRLYLLAFASISICLQIFILARAAGFARPLGLDRESVVRLAFVAAGLVFVWMGNLSARVPGIESRFMDAGRQQKGHRFQAWVFVLGGLALAAANLALPFEWALRVFALAIPAMIVLPVVHRVVLWAGFRREKRSGAGR